MVRVCFLASCFAPKSHFRTQLQWQGNVRRKSEVFISLYWRENESVKLTRRKVAKETVLK